MTYQEDIDALRTTQQEISEHFVDANGHVIKIGDFVRYTEDHRSRDFTSAWHPDRWGMVTGLTRTNTIFNTDEYDLGVKVTTPYVIASRKEANYGRSDEWFSPPHKLEVVK
jgi:hypothetical protein